MKDSKRNLKKTDEIPVVKCEWVEEQPDVIYHLFVQCPHCKDTTGYYITVAVSGVAIENKQWDGIPDDNGTMWDKIKYGKESKYRRCQNCDKLVGENL